MMSLLESYGGDIFFLIIYLAEKKIQKLKNIKNVIKLSIKLYVGFLLSFQEIFLK